MAKEIDPFEEAEAAPSMSPPSMKQLGKGGTKRQATYAKGTENPVVRESSGRMVLMKPVKVDRNYKNPNFKNNDPSDRWHVNIVVLDGEPIVAKEDKDGEIVSTYPEPLVPPFELSSAYVSNTLIAGQLEKAFAKGTMIIGQVMLLPPKSQGGNKAWAIGDSTDEAKKVARQWIKDHPEPDEFDS
jgi:hypothetical protein